MKKLKKFFLLIAPFIGLIFASGYGNRKNKASKEKTTLINKADAAEPTIQHTEQEAPTITIWIHGTRLFPDFTFRNFFYTPSGFTTADEIQQKYHIRKITDRLVTRDPKRFNQEHFYIFGWSGRASFSARKDAAQELYKELEKLTKEYKESYGIGPSIRIITHSHGGNVALNLPAVKEKEPPFTIKELILLGCPVQEATKKYIEDPLFERCYSFSSKADFLQVIDPQGLYRGQGGLSRNPLFSQRVFPSHQKLSQARIKINGRYILHVEFLLRRFITNLPSILDTIDENHKQTQLTSEDNPETQNILVINLKKRVRKKKT